MGEKEIIAEYVRNSAVQADPWLVFRFQKG